MYNKNNNKNNNNNNNNNSYIAEGLALFDKEVRQCFSECTALDTSDIDWMQAQLSLSRGGLALAFVACHAIPLQRT